ncbi:MAG: thiamine pyrophosphate-binding protein [Actinomycetota bacterium]
MSEPTGGAALVAELQRQGVDAAFGVVSVHNLPLVDALAHELRWVPTRTESGAVNAADGYARATGGLGCAVTSTGTGAGNAAGALIEALSAATSLLHVTGQIDSPWLGQGRGVIHETPQQLAMLDAVSTAALAVTADADPATTAAATLAAATRLARGPQPGPVSVEWPIDLQYRPAGPRSGADAGTAGEPDGAQAYGDTAVGDPDAVQGHSDDGDGDRDLDPGALAAAVALLAAARRPLVWLGGGARSAPAAVEALVTALGAGVVTSNTGRGVLPESSDQRVVGNFATAAACAPLLADADLLVTVGTHFRSNETRTYALPLPRPHVQIDLDPAAIGRCYPVDAPLVGPAQRWLPALLDGLATTERPGPDPGWAARVAETRAACRAALRADIGPFAAICDALAQGLPPATNLVRDITIPNSAWGNRLLPVDDPTTNIYPRGGGIGQALAMGIGAAVGRPDRHTLVLIGDGGLQVQLGELATLRQERLDVTVVVFDDGGYGVLRNTQDRHVGRRSGVDLFTPDVAAAAAAHDLPCTRVDDAADFGAALAARLSAGGPGVLHVDCDKIGPMPKPFTPPVDVPGVGT